MSPPGEDLNAAAESPATETARLHSAAAERDRQADLRDAAAGVRDASATERELRATSEDAERLRPGPTRGPDRQWAGHDRRSAAGDRTSSGLDREAAAQERDRAAVLINHLMHDELTGFYQRGPGLTELEREVLKSQRTGEPFTIAFVDIDGLKVTNDEEGHDAGDRLIAEVAKAVQSVLREYDVVMRYGGDEFVCGMQGLGESEAKARFVALNQRLSKAGGRAASVGVSQLRPAESLQTLISRADAAMYEEKLSKGTQR